MKQVFFYLGVAAGMIIPFFSIPLILKIRKNRSSKDISLVWTVGVWVCALAMLPQALLSPDLSYKLFAVVNASTTYCARATSSSWSVAPEAAKGRVARNSDKGTIPIWAAWELFSVKRAS